MKYKSKPIQTTETELMAKKRPTAFCATEGENIYVKVMKIIEMIRLNTESMKAKIATSKAGTNTVPLYVPFRCRNE